MPDISYIFGLAFLILALVAIFAVFRAISGKNPGGGPHGGESSLGQRGRDNVGSPLFPPPPEVVNPDVSGPDSDSSAPSDPPHHGHDHGHHHGHSHQGDMGGAPGHTGGSHSGGHTDAGGGFSGGSDPGGAAGGHHHH